MAKKLLIVWLSITMVTFSSISIYAKDNSHGDFFIPRPALDENSQEADLSAMSATGKEESHTVIVSKEAQQKQKLEQLEKKEKQEQEEYRNGLAAYIRHINRNVGKEKSKNMAKYFISSADKYDLDEKLIMALAQKESTFYSDATSSEDFKGLMQTGDGIARNAGYEANELYNPKVSIKVGTRYLSIKMDEFGDKKLALTAYNQGSGSVHSGNYSTGYAETVMEYRDNINNYLEKNGYPE
ncbi:MAG: transglycosylase SLT domain-containing protein [Anaerovoracaceae bacterium]